MRSHRFINSLLYLVIHLVAKESKAKESNAGIRCPLFRDALCISGHSLREKKRSRSECHKSRSQVPYFSHS